MFGLFKQKLTKSDLADFLLHLEREWAASWLEHSNEGGNAPERGYEISCHTLALFVLTAAVRDDIVRDLVHSGFCESRGMSPGERTVFLELVSESYSRLFPALNAFLSNPSSGLRLSMAIQHELSMYSDDTEDMMQGLTAFARFMEQLKATHGALGELKRKYRVEGLQ